MNVLKAPVCIALYSVARLVRRRLVTNCTANGTRQEVPGRLWRGIGVRNGVLALMSSCLCGMVASVLCNVFVPPKAIILVKE